ncbi:hypothetical protein DPMN_145284 [Dreissena polymorpha]|uniref:Uncharacterized protein n=1 Tax=Dreissena polymorpha TaxID=45954 RepID=A0A9D4J0W2_DREPO|nr:hypothetical protein DPMN_145284 [Dreissena polymorpha]
MRHDSAREPCSHYVAPCRSLQVLERPDRPKRQLWTFTFRDDGSFRDVPSTAMMGPGKTVVMPLFFA